jgi:glycosyltransferase involved in cell wall biosynthesis
LDGQIQPFIMKKLPRITVVTPSFNQGGFLRDTIESVLGQGYPDLEYIIMDGGSTDGSVEIIKEYQDRLSFWCSEPDGGQAAAINKAFARSTGTILAWLNSDDYYLPGTLRCVADALDVGAAQLLLGNCLHFHEGTPQIHGSDVPLRHQQLRLTAIDYIIQPSSFWTKVAWQRVGLLEDTFHYVFDWDWYIRATQAKVTVKTTSRYLSAYRIHPSHKSGTGGEKREQEIRAIYLKHSGPRLLKMHDDCRVHARRIAFVRKWISNFRLSRLVKRSTLLKWFLPGIFHGISDKDIDAFLGLVSGSSNSRRKKAKSAR